MKSLIASSSHRCSGLPVAHTLPTNTSRRQPGPGRSRHTAAAEPSEAAAPSQTIESLESFLEPDEQPLEAAQPAGPATAGEAIALGIEKLNGGEAEAAVELFQTALGLPGKGAMRLKTSPREYSCASEGEEIAALYNLACAYASLGKTESALASLEGAFGAGFKDFAGLRSDPDLKSLQGQKLEGLIQQAVKDQEAANKWNPLKGFSLPKF